MSWRGATTAAVIPSCPLGGGAGVCFPGEVHTCIHIVAAVWIGCSGGLVVVVVVVVVVAEPGGYVARTGHGKAKLRIEPLRTRVRRLCTYIQRL
jgi:hypothetical protein